MKSPPAIGIVGALLTSTAANKVSAGAITSFRKVHEAHMRYTIVTIVIAMLFLAGVVSYCNAASYDYYSYGSTYSYGTPANMTIHSLASRSLAMISHASRYGIDTARAMHYQTEGDEALHRGDFVRAAEECGRAEEAVRILEVERSQALDARRIAGRDLNRARVNGTYNVGPAEIDFQHGNEALSTGDYVTAQLYYAEARASLAVGAPNQLGLR
jgi:hypothetical protein